MIRDDWEWDIEAPFHPLFGNESRRRDYLRGKRTLTPLETKELADGYLPWSYVGATYFGHPVNVSRMMDGTNDRPAWLLNNPNQWIDLSPALSTRNWPQGPPGWIPLTPGVHYSATRPLPAGMDRFRVLPWPWDAEWSKLLREQ